MKTAYDLMIESLTKAIKNKLNEVGEVPAAVPTDPTAIPAADPNAATTDPTMAGTDPNAAATPVDSTEVPATDPMATGETPDEDISAEPEDTGEAETDEMDDSTISIIKQLDPKQREYVRRYAMSLLNGGNDNESDTEEKEETGDDADIVAENIILSKRQLNKVFESFRDVTDEDEKKKQDVRKSKAKSKHGKKQSSTKSPFNSPIKEDITQTNTKTPTSPDDIDISAGNVYSMTNKKTGSSISGLVDDLNKNGIQQFAYDNEQLGDNNNYTFNFDKSSSDTGTSQTANTVAENKFIFTKGQIQNIRLNEMDKKSMSFTKKELDECGLDPFGGMKITVVSDEDDEPEECEGGMCDMFDDFEDSLIDGIKKIGDEFECDFDDDDDYEDGEEDHEPIAKKFSKPFVVDDPEDDEYEIVGDED